ncbi:uncharacterized protein LOC135463190 [Liolophura sinensis]|uniref:uncharacterized protein LOC135463190 n=1 Tax=Liolophura sinensis TaxID=3198878 RepID=UPI0031588B34
MASRRNASFVVNATNITALDMEEICGLIDTECPATLFDPPTGGDSEDSPGPHDDSWPGETREAEELMVKLDGLPEKIHTGLFIASHRDSQNTHRYTVVDITENSAFSVAELKQEEEILRVNDLRLYGQKPSDVQKSLRDVIRTSHQETLAFTLTVRRQNKGDYSSGYQEFLKIELIVRVNIIRMETARVYASRQRSHISGYGGVLFQSRVVGTVHDIVQIHLKPKYHNVYISFNSRAQDKLTPTPKRRRKDAFNRTTYVGYDTRAKKPVFVVTLELIKRPGYYLAVHGSEVVLKRYDMGANPYTGIEHPERFFIIGKIGERDLYESLKNREHYVSYEDRTLSLHHHDLTVTKRPPDSIVFAQDFSAPEISSGSSIFSGLLALIGATIEAVRRTAK